MSSFDKREEGFEKKFAMDEEQKFKAEARRNKLLGLWAAEKLGISGDAAAAYAKEVVAADFEEAGDGDVLRKVSRRSYRQGHSCHRSAGSREDGRADAAGDYPGEGGDVGARRHSHRVSRTRCGILYAAAQSRDRTKHRRPLRPRLCTASGARRG